MRTQLDALRTSRAGESLRILVVDDFAPFRESLYRVFLDDKSSTIVGEAADGEAAIEMAFRLAPHVIIMDVKMPRISGVEATRRIKRFLPGVHVIGVSTQDDSFIKESMKAAGSSHFVTKESANTVPDIISSIPPGPLRTVSTFAGPLD
jgi:two-component system, NarL family, response regulator DegU